MGLVLISTPASSKLLKMCVLQAVGWSCALLFLCGSLSFAACSSEDEQLKSHVFRVLFLGFYQPTSWKQVFLKNKTQGVQSPEPPTQRRLVFGGFWKGGCFTSLAPAMHCDFQHVFKSF